jgi:hypothetical protein
MGFVVKVIVRDGSVCWLIPLKADGIRAPGPREKAEVFQTRKDAQDVTPSITPAYSSQLNPPTDRQASGPSPPWPRISN